MVVCILIFQLIRTLEFFFFSFSSKACKSDFGLEVSANSGNHGVQALGSFRMTLRYFHPTLSKGSKTQWSFHIGLSLEWWGISLPSLTKSTCFSSILTRYPQERQAPEKKKKKTVVVVLLLLLSLATQISPGARKPAVSLRTCKGKGECKGE